MGVKIEMSGLAGEIAQSVRTLLDTPVGTLVCDREYGVDLDGVDQLPDAAEALLLTELEEKLQRYEPRVRVEDIAAATSSEGVTTLRVVMAYAGESTETSGVT